MRRVTLAIALALSSFVVSHAQTPRLVRGQSGPSGKVVGSDFILDETRNRFVYPQDRTVTVSFEWEWPAGDHVLTATWKRPDGRVASVSPEVKIQTPTPKLTAYWMFEISPNVGAGTWTVEIRIDGQPAASHAFEVIGTEPERFTLDRVVKTFEASVVRIHKLDAQGHRIDTSSGSVIGTNAVATAFQAIDMAAGLEIEFADGRKVQTAEVLANSRLDDWAIVKVDTGGIVPIPRGNAATVPVGSRLAAFNVDAGTRVIMPVDVGAVSAPAGYGLRIRFSPGASSEAAGGPLIDEDGKLVGVVGGSLTPGSRPSRLVREQVLNFSIEAPANSGAAISLLPASIPAAGSSLADLAASRVLSPPVNLMPEFHYGGVTRDLTKNGSERSVRDEREFSSRDDIPINVYGYWVKRGKVSKGEISAAIFDASNHQWAAFPPKKITLKDDEQRVAISFSGKGLRAGYYRIDMCWDGQAVWRAYIHITE